MSRRNVIFQSTALVRMLLAAACAWEASTAYGQSRREFDSRQVTLTTRDGVELAATYYPSDAGRDAVPVVLLHDFNETRSVYDSLARSLQEGGRRNSDGEQTVKSRAVVAVDMRGHGGSKTGFDRGGRSFELDAQRFVAQDFVDMVLLDMEAVRGLLVEENDRGRLNLNKLCVVGSGMGANVAVLWAARDWATPPLAVRKQGQDVKALVLLSPRWNFRGLKLVEPFKFPPIQQAVSVYLCYGANDAAVARDCRNIEKILNRYHPEPPSDQRAKKDFFVDALDTTLQGTSLLAGREFDVAPRIAEFIQARLGLRELPYSQRKK